MPTIGMQCLKEAVMECLKFEPLSSQARLACAAFALVSCLASVSFVVLSFASASAGAEATPARPKPHGAGAIAAEQRPTRPARGCSPSALLSSGFQRSACLL